MKYILLHFSLSVVLWAQAVSFDTITKQAIDYNIELKIIKTNIDITEAKIEEINALYYPTVSIGFNAQYTKGLGEETGSMASIGDSVLSSQTQYESSATLKLDYDIYDFGARSAKIDIAQIDRKLVDYEMLKSKQDLKIKLLDIYAKILRAKKELYYYAQIIKLQKKIYTYKKRLYKAGEVDKVFVENHSVLLSNLKSKYEQIKSSLDEALHQLSYYTGTGYTTKSKFKKLHTRKSLMRKYQESWQYREWELQKEKKRKELALHKAQQYPTIKLYGKYNFYGTGSERCTIWCSLYDMEARNYVVGISASMTLFNGFQSSATEKRLKAELLQLELQEMQESRRLIQQQEETRQNVRYASNDIKNYRSTISKQNRKDKMNSRLYEIKEVTAIDKLEGKIELLYKKLELKIREIEKSVKLKELEILNEG